MTTPLAAFQSYSLEYRLRLAAGVYRWHSAQVTPLRDADGKVVA
ncbi:MAG: PAS domain-containing protein [Acidobacteriaceae bacterium]|nr:PAS domain-containing protein [Acidobacteriaceae bacterium]